ncbi:MAG: amidohydrolase [Chloroflexi bacterium RBG_16_50_9]|nr:MAG: amidohydrolase [Chloroflexi bacterium RBG_16_50_9]
MNTERETWLKTTMEEAIDPGLPICDPHHHLWYHTHHGYSLKNFLGDAVGGHNIVQTVYVESWLMLKNTWPPEKQPASETELVQNMVKQNAAGKLGKTNVAAGIVGFADLTMGDAVNSVLESHLSASEERFRGIRQACAWDASGDIKSPWPTPRGLMTDPMFRKGFACLHKYGLSFDAWAFHPQLPELLDLARDFPETTIVLNHIGGPLGVGPYAGRAAEVFNEWKRAIMVLASCHNVFVKLGGLGMELCGFGWHRQGTPPGSAELAEKMAPYYLWCIEQFGANRCMFESNFPVDRMSYSYTVIWNAFKRVSKDFSNEERRFLFHDTAARAYRLQPGL